MDDEDEEDELGEWRIFARAPVEVGDRRVKFGRELDSEARRIESIVVSVLVSTGIRQ